MPNAQPRGPSLAWLIAGAVAGLIAAGFGLLDRGTPANGLGDDSVARVGESLIPAARFERAVVRLEQTLGSSLDADQRALVLEQLIDEELLLQRGRELGLAESDPAVRAAIVQSLVASVTAEADAADPDDETLRAFMQERPDRYTWASALHLDAWVSDDEDPAREFLAQLQSDSAGGSESASEPPPGLEEVSGMPDGLAPVERLRMFVGPAIAAAATDLPVGAAAVFARQGRWYVIRVVERETEKLAELDAVRSQVLVDYRRRLADERLREYLEGLREQTDIIVAAP